MSELKRKREDGEDPGAADVAGADPSDESASPASAVDEAGAPEAGAPAAASSPTTEPTAAPTSSGASAATAQEEEEAAAIGGAPASSLPSPPPAERAPKQKKRPPPAPEAKILICGKEVLVKHTGGRKKRKHPLETLIVFAYKGQLAMACKANNMLNALEIYREMKTKGIQQDLETHIMVLSLCGGSPGGKDELNPGNGSTAKHDAALTKAAAADVARGRVQGASAQDNTHAAAEAALQVFSDASNGGTVSLPESAYTAVIRACCLDGRADKARETLEALKRAGVRPRVRTYAPLLEAYSLLEGRLQDCMALWREAASQRGIMMTEREYLHLISACTRARDEKCFLEVMAEYMDDVLQPRSRHSWDVLKAWFKVGPNVIGNGVSEPDSKPAATPEEPAEQGQVVGDSTADAALAGERTEEPSNGDGRVDGEGQEAGRGAVVSPTSAAVEAAASAPAAAAETETVAAPSPASTTDAAGGGAGVAVVDGPGDARAADSCKEDLRGPAKEPPPPSSPSLPAAAAPAPTAAAAPDPEGGDSAAGDRKEASTGDCSGDGDDPMGVSQEPQNDHGVDAPAGAANCESPSGGDGDVTTTGDSSSGGGWAVEECKVRADGTCENCGEVLRSIDLSPDDEQRLLKQIEELVCTNEERTKQWHGFRGWLERRGKSSYNVIIDGANLGYYRQAADSQEELADLRQIDWAVKQYQEMGKKPLVVLHSRHLVAKWLSDEAKEIYQRWKAEGIIQSCAPKNNDDWYWLYTAVYMGGSVLVLTNDEMRDHHFSMLSHRSFQRWKERHQARFCFGDWNEEGERRELIPEEPRSYSKRTQKGFNSWHVPLEHTGDWLCARWR